MSAIEPQLLAAVFQDDIPLWTALCLMQTRFVVTFMQSFGTHDSSADRDLIVEAIITEAEDLINTHADLREDTQDIRDNYQYIFSIFVELVWATGTGLTQQCTTVPTIKSPRYEETSTVTKRPRSEETHFIVTLNNERHTKRQRRSYTLRKVYPRNKLPTVHLKY